MEERRQIVQAYKAKGLSISKATAVAGISRSSYYYQPRKGRPGRKAEQFTEMMDGQVVNNEQVLEVIKDLAGEDFLDYGYHKTYKWLQQQGYRIGKDKTYRLMKEAGLLHPNRKAGFARNFVKYTRVLPSRPYEIFEMDIKFIYVHGSGQNALLLTLIDTFTRKALVWKCGYSIKKKEVKALIEELIINYLQPQDLLNRKLVVVLRTDNGSQFIAGLVRGCLKENEIHHEFTKPGTPQQNGHIEAFHSIVERSVAEKFEFENMGHLKEVLKSFYQVYNEERIHSSLCYLTPELFLWAWDHGYVQLNQEEKHPSKRFKLKEKPYHIRDAFKQSKNYKLAKSGEAEAGSAGEQPARNSLTDGDEAGKPVNEASPALFKKSSLSHMPKKTP